MTITPTTVWPQARLQEGTQPHPSAENWIKDLLSMPLPTRTRPSFPQSQSLPSGILHKPLILFHQRADRMKPQSQKTNQAVNTWTTILPNSMKLWATACGATQDRWVMVESSDKTWSTGERNSEPLQYSCFENPMNSMKRQKGHWKMNSPGQ